MNLLIDKQFRKSIPKDPKHTINCQEKIEQLAAALDEGKEKEFLKKHDGKPMKGVKNIFKFQATHSDRIIYMHTNDSENLRKRFPNSIVLLRYANHDEQARVASRIETDNVDAEKFKRNFQTDFHFDDCVKPQEVESYIETMVSNIINIEQLSEYLSSTDEYYDVLLSDEQFKVLENSKLPLILTGCAGSGKTIVSIHMLFNFYKTHSNEGKKSLYTSLSRDLCSNTQKLFGNIPKNDTSTTEFNSNVKFEDLNSLLKDTLKLKNNYFVQFSDFENIFCEDNKQEMLELGRYGITPFDLWSEIRSVLKGSLNECWEWSIPLKRSQLTDEIIDCFSNDYKLIKNIDNKYKEFILIDPCKRPSQRLKEMMASNEIAYTYSQRKQREMHLAVEKLDKHFFSFDSSKRMLSLSEYILLDESHSIYADSLRKKIYPVFEKYDAWLKSNGYYDDNDLARMFLSDENKLKQTFAFIVIDEMQDFTEMQILALYHMSSNPLEIVFSGDIHQVINPTYFSESRISSLYYLKQNQTKVDEVGLKKNYRSQDKIVTFANELSRLRREKIGSRSQLSEISEESIIEGWKPMMLAPDKENIKKIVNRINDLSYAAIVVQNEDDCDKLCDLLEDEYNGGIYTIQKIKGLEKKYILCYNLISTYNDEWNDIFSDKDIRRNSKYRYYFNTFYVGITRAQEHLCIIEDKIPPKVSKWIDKFFLNENYFDNESLFLFDESNSGEDWYQSARRSELNADYERAIIQYKKSSHNDFLFCVERCNMKILLKKRQAKKALELCFEQIGNVKQTKELLEIIVANADDDRLSKLSEQIILVLSDETPESYLWLIENVLLFRGGERLAVMVLEKIGENSFFKLSEMQDLLKKEELK